MQTIGIKELQVNPAKLTQALETKQYTMITKRSNPIGVAIAFDDNILSNGLKTALLIDGFKQGNLSLGQLSNSLTQLHHLNLQKAHIQGLCSIF
jgi:hypothetical protein